jgi:puromycin-sensitive aminopeptidase
VLEQHLGPEVFRDGVRQYLRRHAYANADTGDLWIALGQASRQSVPTLMDGWIFHPGYPLITVRPDHGMLILTQQRFTYLPAPAENAPSLPPSPPAGGRGEGEGENSKPERRWQVPVQLRMTAKGKPVTRQILLTGAEHKVDLPEGFEHLVMNEGGHGFYRVRYDATLLKRLLALLPKGLSAIERFNLVNDAWAAAVAGLTPVSEYLDLTARFRTEPDRNVWTILIESFHALNRIIDPAERPLLEGLVRDRLRVAVKKLGWAPRPGESELTRQLRGDLLRTFGTIGNDQQTQTRARELYTQYVKTPSRGDAFDPDIVLALIAILAHVGDRARYAEFLERFRAAPTPQEERRYLYALAAFQPTELADQTLSRTINGEIRTQDAPFMVAVLLTSVYSRERAWSFVKANWDTLDRLLPKNGVRRMLHGITGLATPELERDVRQFIAGRQIHLGGKTLEQYLEQLRIAVAFRAREGPALIAYLKKLPSDPA